MTRGMDHEDADQRPTLADHGHDNRSSAFFRDAFGVPGADVTAGTPKNNPQTRGSGAMTQVWDGGKDVRKPGVVVSESPRVRWFRPKSASPLARSTSHEPLGSMGTSAAGILSSPVRMAPSSSFPLESPQHWSTPSSDSHERASQRTHRSSTSRLSHTPKSPGQILHDPSFHPGRRCCYQLGANSAEAESARLQLFELFESWCFNSKDKFQVCLESCTHGRPAASLRNGLDALKDREAQARDADDKTGETQYQAYAHVLEQKVAKLNGMGSGSLGLSTSLMHGLVPHKHYGTLAQLLGATEYAAAKVPLEFCHNQAICMAPAGAKSKRWGEGRMARIGSFEVLVAVYRFNENHWYEFVLFSKLDSQQFPRLSTIESLLHSLVVRAAGMKMRATLAAMLLQTHVRKKLTQARFSGLLFMVGCNTACGCLFVYVCLCLSWCICLSLCVCLCVMCDAAARHGVCGVHQIACG